MKIHQQSFLSYRIQVAIRCVLAIAGGYLLAASSNLFLALYLPLSRSEAVLTANMLCFIIYVIAICWVFAVSHTWKAAVGIALPTLFFAVCILIRQGGIHP